MTEHPNGQPAIDINKVKNKLLQQKAEINRLESKVMDLQTELMDTQAEHHRVLTESQLAMEDSDLARSFSQKNYAPVLLDIFEKPSKQLRNRATGIIILAVITAIAAGYFSAGYLTYTHNIVISKQLDSIQQQLATSSAQQEKLQQILDSQTKANQKSTRQESLTKPTPANTTSEILHINSSTTTNIASSSALNADEIAAETAKQNIILQQAKMIYRYVRAAEQKEGFLTNYTNDKTQLAQLYLIVMQNSSNENIYYEAHLKALDELGIADNIKPKTVNELLQFDIDFLQAAYAGFIITSQKNLNGWRYREEDRRFSSYYNSELDYNLGTWQIVNEAKDYKTLPSIFSLNIKRISQQLTFNEKKSALQLPEKIYYKAYAEPAKNDAIKKLLNQTSLSENNGALIIDASIINLTINSSFTEQLKERLTINGFSVAGDNKQYLTTAINDYRADKGWEKNGYIDRRLLNRISLYPTYEDLQLP